MNGCVESNTRDQLDLSVMVVNCDVQSTLAGRSVSKIGFFFFLFFFLGLCT